MTILTLAEMSQRLPRGVILKENIISIRRRRSLVYISRQFFILLLKLSIRTILKWIFSMIGRAKIYTAITRLFHSLINFSKDKVNSVIKKMWHPLRYTYLLRIHHRVIISINLTTKIDVTRKLIRGIKVSVFPG